MAGTMFRDGDINVGLNQIGDMDKGNVGNGDGAANGHARQITEAEVVIDRLLALDVCVVVGWMAYCMTLFAAVPGVRLALQVLIAIVAAADVVLVIAMLGKALRLLRRREMYEPLFQIAFNVAAAVVLVLQMFVGVF